VTIRQRNGLRSARRVFIGSGNCDVSGDHWIQTQRRRWSMPSLLLASTIVRHCWRVHRRLRLTSYSVSWMRLRVLLSSVDTHAALGQNYSCN